MANEQAIRNRRGSLLTTIKPGRTVNISTLTLTGYGVGEYGQLRDNAYLYLLENFYNITAPVDPIEGQLWWKRNDQLYVWTLVGSPEGGMWDTVVPSADTLGFDVGAGDGLTGGGFPTNSPAEVVINVGAGTGVRVGSPAGFISVKESEINHDNLSGFDANDHVDHTTVQIIAGDGIKGGGYIAGSPNPIIINVGQGDGIEVRTDDIRVDNTVLLISGSPANQTTTGNYVSQDQLRAYGPGAGSPVAGMLGYTFIDDLDTGIRRAGTDVLSFVAGGRDIITIQQSGVMRAGSPYPITADDDIPTKNYVDSLGSSGTSPTENTFIGTSSLTGLTPGKIYQLHAYGLWYFADVGTLGNTTASTVYVRDGTTLGSGTILPAPTAAGSPTFALGTAFAWAVSTFNWFDGDAPVQHTFIVKALSSSLHVQVWDGGIYGGSDRFSTYLIGVELGDG
jgi:hypothetical protein